MSTYAWIIDKDHLTSGSDDEAGTMGPRTAPSDLVAALKAGKGLKFRMHDDDNELYYSGRWIDQEGSTPETLPEEAFGPLDDFGAPNAGCTTIRYRMRDEARWEIL